MERMSFSSEDDSQVLTRCANAHNCLGLTLGRRRNPEVTFEVHNVMYVALPCPMDPKGSEGDPKCIFVSLNTYQVNFDSDICRN